MAVGRLDFRTKDGIDTEHLFTLEKGGIGIRWLVVSLDIYYDGDPPQADMTIVGCEEPVSIPILSQPSDMFYSRRFAGYISRENTDIVVTIPGGGAGVRGVAHLTAFKILSRQLESGEI